MNSDDGLRAGYDETPYRDDVLPHLDLSRLLGFARLFSLDARAGDLSNLRVLDLACSSGAHIRQQAARYPVPPLSENSPLMRDGPSTFNLPPVITKSSELCNSPIWCVFAAWVTTITVGR